MNVPKSVNRWVLRVVTLLLVGGMFAACAPAEPLQPVQQPGTYSIDPLFREFFASLGGDEILGPAITAAFSFHNFQCQYAQNALMCFDPFGQGVQRFSLYPLGRGFELDHVISTQSGADNFPIYEEFEMLYSRLGWQYTGKALTPPRYNPNKNRIEQYFENVGFYRNIDDPQGEARLLSYGVYACSADCRYSPPVSAVVVRNVVEIEQPFLPRLARMGGVKVFGLPLGHPRIAEDGLLEQVYENVVLFSPPDNPAAMQLRPTAVKLGMPASAPQPRQHSEADGVVFYPLEGELGFHVPLAFDQFIASHGGLEISGKPLMDPYQVGENLFRQCFENYCLDYDNQPGVVNRVRMVALGREYLRAAGGEPAEQTAFQITQDAVRLAVNVVQPRVAADQGQRFELLLLEADNQQPVSSVESSLTLTLPDGTQALYYLPPTDAKGSAGLLIAPLQPPPPNGSVIAYRLCLNVPADPALCAGGSYLIWNYR
ncbi:MAG: hypothetical protein AB1453_00665 [Chloroflexota bacterium]